MARYQCNTCQGEYDELGADGMLYFHACPPLHRARVRREGQELELEASELRETDEVLERRTINRPDHRDENRNPNDRDERGLARIRAEGRGRAIVRR
jgi:hypothetical protein